VIVLAARQSEEDLERLAGEVSFWSTRPAFPSKAPPTGAGAPSEPQEAALRADRNPREGHRTPSPSVRDKEHTGRPVPSHSGLAAGGNPRLSGRSEPTEKFPVLVIPGADSVPEELQNLMEKRAYLLDQSAARWVAPRFSVRLLCPPKLSP